MSEHEGDISHNPDPHLPYYRAARFRREAASLRAYQNLESLFFREECDLSAYRFIWDQGWHVAALGSQPEAKLQERVESILSVGQATSLPEQLLRELQRRRAQSTQLGPWVERHFRFPGS